MPPRPMGRRYVACDDKLEVIISQQGVDQVAELRIATSLPAAQQRVQSREMVQ